MRTHKQTFPIDRRAQQLAALPGCETTNAITMDYNEVLEMVNRIVDDRIEAAIDSARQEWEQYTDSARQEWEQYTDQVRREIEERIDDLE